MIDNPDATSKQSGWRFPSTFWYANGAELCERAAYYGMFITLIRYLHDMVGFSDKEAGWVAGLFSSILYLLPTFMGIMADKIGFRRALLVAFTLLTAGYGVLGAFQLKSTAIASLVLIMFGGAIVKPVISGTAAKCSTDATRARAMSIFYMVVNIGAFSGKGLAGDLNDRLGLQYINFYAAGMAFTALVLVALFYRNVDNKGTGKTVVEALRGLLTVMGNFRFLSLILIVAGFWAIQGQLYASMPTYIERLMGTGTKPEWLANINPLVVVLLVVPITHLVRDFKPVNAIGIGLLIIPFTALIIALSPALEEITGRSIDLRIIVLHPITLMIAIGIGLQGLAECFLSPKFLEYASKQAPEGEVGLYLGYQHLTTFFAWLFGFVLSGYLLDAYCPDPKHLAPDARQQWRMATDPTYRFALPLDEELRNDLDRLGEDTRIATPIIAAFRDHGIDLPEGITVTVGEREGQWMLADAGAAYTLKRWEVEGDGEPEKLAELLVCVDTARSPEAMPPLPEAYNRAHYIWYVFTGVGFTAFLGMLVFKLVTGVIDRRRAVAR